MKTAVIRILSMPVRSKNNRYFNLFSKSLEDDGMRVLGIRDTDALLLKFDVLHFHFPAYFNSRASSLESMIWSAMFIALLLCAKLLRKRVVYTVHNVLPIGPHYRGWLFRPYIKIVHSLCDAFIFLSLSSQQDFYQQFPDQRHKLATTIAHGPYPAMLLSPQVREECRSKLKGTGFQESLIVGVLGDIKAYKGLEILSKLPDHLSDGRPIRAVVAGRVERGYEAVADAIMESLRPGMLVRIDKRLSDDELDELIQSVDVVLLPYTRGTNSGFAHLVLSNRGRILGSDLPLFRDLLERVGEPWVQCYRSTQGTVAESLKHELECLSAKAVTQEDEDRLERYLSESSFSVGAAQFRALYEQTLLRATLRQKAT